MTTESAAVMLDKVAQLPLQSTCGQGCVLLAST